MRVVDMMLAVMAGRGSSLLNVIIAVAVAFLPRFARLQRAVTLTVRECEFVLAAIALGSTHWRVLPATSFRIAWPPSSS